jgi:hypothetical protein
MMQYADMHAKNESIMLLFAGRGSRAATTSVRQQCSVRAATQTLADCIDL